MKSGSYKVPYPFGKDRYIEIKPTANAWWMDQARVFSLLDSFRNRLTIEEACLRADVTVRQYKYFVEIHPEFNEIRVAYRSLAHIEAKRTLIDGIRGNVDQARWWATHMMKDEFGRRRKKSEKPKDPPKSTYSPEVQEKLDKLTEEYHKKFRQIVIGGPEPVRKRAN